jgi:hypothetical protein
MYPRHRRSASAKNLLILGPKISWSLQLPGRVFDQEILIDDFAEDGLQVGPRQFHAILRQPFRQIVDMGLQHEPVD